MSAPRSNGRSGCRANRSTSTPSTTSRPRPWPQTPKVTQDALARAVDIMRERVDQLGVAEPLIQTSGGNPQTITVDLPAVKDIARAEKIVGTTARLEFYDWEANVLTPDGKL